MLKGEILEAGYLWVISVGQVKNGGGGGLLGGCSEVLRFIGSMTG